MSRQEDSSQTPIGASPDDGFAAVAHLVQEIPRRCAIKGCRARPEVMVAMADQAGIVGEDSLLVAASCRPHHRDVAERLGHSIVAARIKHDYPDATRADIGKSIALGHQGRPS